MSQTQNFSKPGNLFDKTAYTIIVLMGIYCLICLNLVPAVLFFAVGMRYFYTMLKNPYKEITFSQYTLLSLHLLVVTGTLITLLSR